MIETEEKCSECGAPYMKGDVGEPHDDLCPKCRGEEDTVVFEASAEAVAGIAEQLRTGAEPDFTVTAARLSSAGTGEHGPYVVIAWETKGAGFGELTFHHKDGKLHVDTECMSQRFVSEVLAKLVEGAVVT